MTFDTFPTVWHTQDVINGSNLIWMPSILVRWRTAVVGRIAVRDWKGLTSGDTLLPVGPLRPVPVKAGPVAPRGPGAPRYPVAPVPPVAPKKISTAVPTTSAMENAVLWWPYTMWIFNRCGNEHVENVLATQRGWYVSYQFSPSRLHM